ncbi:HD-GYP domain-containing protein [Desulfocurvus sp. DL9XJH121]
MTILIIDDEESLRRSLGAFLEDMDFDVLEAENGRQGLDVLAEDPQAVEAVIVDLNMPIMDGYAFIPHALKLAPETPIVVLSGVGVVEDAVRAVRLGAWDYITKPLQDMEILYHAISKALERARLKRENRMYQENLEKLVKERTAELETSRRQVMQRLSRAAEYKDNETGLHVIRVGEISALLGRAMGLSEERCEMLRDCAPLHDVGKIGIPDSILLKPGKLDEAEWEVMRRHCAFGCEILAPLGEGRRAGEFCADPMLATNAGTDDPLLHLARTLALLHHERWDGTGYPFGLRGEDIPLEARIVSVVDVYDALASERPYKRAFSDEDSLAIIADGSGAQFDPKVVQAFAANREAIIAIRVKWQETG